MDYPDESNVITRVLMRRKRRVRFKERVMVEAEGHRERLEDATLHN